MTSPPGSGSVSNWIDALKAGDREAAQPLWDRYFARLVGLARNKLRMARRTDADEEDAALSAFASFFDGVDGGRFPVLSDRAELWRLLVTITARKALDRVEYLGAKCRSDRRTLDEADLVGLAHCEQGGLELVVGREPDPEFAAMIAEEGRARLDSLGKDESLRKVALLRMDGHNTREIANALGCCERTVATKLDLIRKLWARDCPDG